ncbi:MAG: Dephospho-CoA kinase [Syntrophaceae bacterium PtaU1.Bin231]|nr:MAG: Dephospho-CoA kinase [Syntrophaceae bacterium PtaU1.Bin231]
MLQVGLTGGIASGKSTVAAMLEERGARLIDFDVLTRGVEAPGRPAWKDIVAAFGRDILLPDLTLDRAKLGAIVFSDPEKLRLLNRCVHPHVFAEWRKRIAAIRRHDPRAIVVSDIPLLVEVGAQDMVDVIVLVHVPPEEQIERLVRRNGIRREEAEARLAAQMPIDRKIAAADYVIDNLGTLEQTRRQVADLWERLVERERMQYNPGGKTI